jgi:hypothetical protein
MYLICFSREKKRIGRDHPFALKTSPLQNVRKSISKGDLLDSNTIYRAKIEDEGVEKIGIRETSFMVGP